MFFLKKNLFQLWKVLESQLGGKPALAAYRKLETAKAAAQIAMEYLSSLQVSLQQLQTDIAQVQAVVNDAVTDLADAFNLGKFLDLESEAYYNIKQMKLLMSKALIK